MTRLLLLVCVAAMIGQIAGATDYYVDNTDPKFYIIDGVWNSANHPNAYNGETRYSIPDQNMKFAGWRVHHLVELGYYDVFVYKFNHQLQHLMSPNVPYRVYHIAGATDVIYVDQRTPIPFVEHEWIYLGNYGFDSSRTQGVLVRGSPATNGIVAADAVYLEYTGPLNPSLPADSLDYVPVELGDSLPDRSGGLNK